MNANSNDLSLVQQIEAASERVDASAIVCCGVSDKALAWLRAVPSGPRVIQAPDELEAQGGGLAPYLDALRSRGEVALGDIVLCVSAPRDARAIGALAVMRVCELGGEVGELLGLACRLGRRVRAGKAQGGTFRFDARNQRLRTALAGDVAGPGPVVRVDVDHGRVCVESSGRLVFEMDPFAFGSGPSSLPTES